jgi:hypothetical protein
MSGDKVDIKLGGHGVVGFAGFSGYPCADE